MNEDKNGGQMQKERDNRKWRENAKENTTETCGALRWGGITSLRGHKAEGNQMRLCVHVRDAAAQEQE